MRTPEQIANLRTLAAALRSGKYRQGRGKLVTHAGGRDYYCCLGVAGCVIGMTNEELYGETSEILMYDDVLSQKYSNIQLDDRHAEAFGFTAEEQDALANRLNDGGYSFAQIADTIERGIDLDDLMLAISVTLGDVTLEEAQEKV